MKIGVEDFENILVEYCIDEFNTMTSIDIKNNIEALRKLKSFCEKAKITLSFETLATINIENLIEGKNCNIVITRSKFEDFCFELFKKCITPIENKLRDTKMTKSQIDDIILIGGLCYIPKFSQLFKNF